MPNELMKNTCSGCTMCCKLLGVEELDKPANKWCKYCDRGKGCKIYPDRPQSCVNFECGYLLSNLPIEFRPDKSRLVITGQLDKISNTVIIHCDPAYPDAINSQIGKKLQQLLIKNNQSMILVIGDKRKLLSYSARHIEKLQNILKDISIMSKMEE